MSENFSMQKHKVIQRFKIFDYHQDIEKNYIDYGEEEKLRYDNSPLFIEVVQRYDDKEFLYVAVYSMNCINFDSTIIKSKQGASILSYTYNPICIFDFSFVFFGIL